MARHKLADHWRKVEREQRGLRRLDAEPDPVDDPWEAALDRMRAREVLGQLGPHHQAALSLRYLDGLPVPEVARRNGASVEREARDQPYGRRGVIVDPFGHRWLLLKPPAEDYPHSSMSAAESAADSGQPGELRQLIGEADHPRVG